MNHWAEIFREAVSAKLWLFDSTGLTALLVLFSLLLTGCLVREAIIATGLARRESDWRELFLYSAVVIGLASVIFVELLSAFNQLNRPWIVTCWVGFIGLLVLLLRKKIGESAGRIMAARLKQLAVSLKKKLRNLSLAEAIIGIILLLTFLVAYIAAPNNWDSMTYHMTKVAHWAQNANTNFYPTNEIRQLYYGPGAEYLILNLQLLVGADRLANMVQWFSYLGSIVLASLLVKRLGGDKKAQALGALAAATIPMAILQATSTQNDLVVALWTLCCINLLFMLEKEPSWWKVTMFGGALALALLTKATSAIFLLPFGTVR